MPFDGTLLSVFTLFKTHRLYGFSTQPHSNYMSDISFQNNKTVYRVAYNAFFICTYKIGFACIYILYSQSSNLTINSAIVPSCKIWIVSSISECRNAPGMSVMVTNLFSLNPLCMISSWRLVTLLGKLHLLWSCTPSGIFCQRTLLALQCGCASFWWT